MSGWQDLERQGQRIRSASEALSILSLAGESMAEPNDGLAVIGFVVAIQEQLEDIKAAIDRSANEWRFEGQQPKS